MAEYWNDGSYGTHGITCGKLVRKYVTARTVALLAVMATFAKILVFLLWTSIPPPEDARLVQMRAMEAQCEFKYKLIQASRKGVDGVPIKGVSHVSGVVTRTSRSVPIPCGTRIDGRRDDGSPMVHICVEASPDVGISRGTIDTLASREHGNLVHIHDPRIAERSWREPMIDTFEYPLACPSIEEPIAMSRDRWIDVAYSVSPTETRTVRYVDAMSLCVQHLMDTTTGVSCTGNSLGRLIDDVTSMIVRTKNDAFSSIDRLSGEITSLVFTANPVRTGAGAVGNSE
jgi:hypothetical protein